MAEFFAMGGYAEFVWPAWGAALLIGLAISIRSLWRSKKVARQMTDVDNVRRHD